MAAFSLGIPRRALRVQANVVGALVLREVRTRFGHSGVGWIWLLCEPLIQCLVYVLLYEFLRTRISPLRGTDIAEFMLSGIVPWLFYMRSTSQVAHAIESNRALLVYPQVTPLDIAIARTILEALIMYVVVAFLLLMKWFLTGDGSVGDLLAIIVACADLAIMGFGIGLMVMAASHFFPILQLTFAYINRMLYFTSGIFFTLSALPPGYRAYVDWNPLLQAIEWARNAYLSLPSNDLLNTAMLTVVVPGLAALGILAERATRDIAKRASTS
ncbi:MAG TPA: ABC transporter permease [Rhizomicrobium sp.]|jgi:capsular polysaccharide transport system permease protein|nr:ABC transporter permease [Rhizomicrobium sp.]